MATRNAWVGGALSVFCVASAGVARADITSYRVGYQINFVQTASDEVRLQWCTFFAGIDCDPGDIVSATVMREGANFEVSMFEIGPGHFHEGLSYDLPIAMESQFPSGIYRFEIQGGLLGEGLGQVVVPSPLHYPDNVPEFDPAQFGEHGAINPAQDYLLRFNTFTSDGNTQTTSLVINADPTGEQVYLGTPAAGAGQWTVPAGTLRYHHRYTATLYFTSLIQTPDAGFNGAAAISHCGYSTRITIQTVQGCPADYNGDGFVDFFDMDAFALAFEAGDVEADFNADGFLDFFDFDAFTVEFEAGC